VEKKKTCMEGIPVMNRAKQQEAKDEQKTKGTPADRASAFVSDTRTFPRAHGALPGLYQHGQRVNVIT
jgi:hypothetical protein